MKKLESELRQKPQAEEEGPAATHTRQGSEEIPAEIPSSGASDSETPEPVPVLSREEKEARVKKIEQLITKLEGIESLTRLHSQLAKDDPSGRVAELRTTLAKAEAEMSDEIKVEADVVGAYLTLLSELLGSDAATIQTRFDAFHGALM